MKNLSFIIVVFLFAQFSQANYSQKINIIGNFIVIDGDQSDARLELSNEYGAIKELKVRKNGNFTFEAEINKNYILSFIKKGYVKKKVIINTYFDGELDMEYLVLKVKLFPQASDVRELVYSQPVGELKIVSSTEYNIDYNYGVTLLPARISF